MKRASKLALLFTSLPLFVVGCFPIELDVNNKGEMLIYRQEGFFKFQPATGKVTPILGRGGGQPVFARFSPNGKEILTVVRDGRGLADHRFDVSSLDGANNRTVFRAAYPAYVQLSPDGSHLAIVRVTDNDNQRKGAPRRKFKQGNTRLVLVKIKDGSSKVLCDYTAARILWYKDGKRLLAFQILTFHKERLHGALVELDAKSGKAKALAAAICSYNMMIDLAPDEKKILFTAYAVGQPGKLLKQNDFFGGHRLFEWSAAEGKVREVKTPAKEVLFASYSPNGERVLLASPSRGFDIEGIELSIADARLQKFTMVETSATEGSRGRAGGLALPGWIDNDTIFYFSKRYLYGLTATSMSLTTMNVAQRRKKNEQPLLDKCAYQSAGKFPDILPPQIFRPKNEPKNDPPVVRPPINIQPNEQPVERPQSNPRPDYSGVVIAVIAIATFLVVVLVGAGIAIYFVVQKPRPRQRDPAKKKRRYNDERARGW